MTTAESLPGSSTAPDLSFAWFSKQTRRPINHRSPLCLPRRAPDVIPDSSAVEFSTRFATFQGRCVASQPYSLLERVFGLHLCGCSAGTGSFDGDSPRGRTLP